MVSLQPLKPTLILCPQKPQKCFYWVENRKKKIFSVTLPDFTLIGENNSEKFFKKVKNITKSKEIKIQMEIEEIADSLSNIFNDNLKVPEEQVEMVNREILSLNIKNFNSIKLSIEEFKSAL
jgi:hypothetical protein